VSEKKLRIEMAEQTYYESIKKGLEQLIAFENGDTSKARVRVVEIPNVEPITEYSKEKIKELRQKNNFTQKTFADVNNNKLCYHGSHIKGLKELLPFSKSHNTIKKEVVYLTPNDSYALFYIWGRPYKWITFESDDNGIIIFTEWFQNQLIEFYKGVSGCIYECDMNNPNIMQTHIKDVLNSEQPVPILNYQEIEDCYTEILKREEMGMVKIKRYNTLSQEELINIYNKTVKAIKMEKLLTSFPEKADFVMQKFPLAWKEISTPTE